MTWWCVMMEPQNIARTVERLTAEGYAPWHPEVAGVNYAFIQAENAPLDARYVDGVLRLLPASDRPQAVNSEAIEIMRATVRAYSAHAGLEPPLERGEPSIAGMARSMLANILRKSGFSVTIHGDRVEPAVALPGRGRSNHGHDARRAMNAPVR